MLAAFVFFALSPEVLIQPHPQLTGEAARNAIVRLLADPDKELFKDEIKALKEQALGLTNAGRTTIGRWVCNLNSKTFVGVYNGKNLILEFRGEFVHEKGRWNARLVGIKRVRLGL